MIDVDKDPGVQLVTDPVLGQQHYKPAAALVEGDVIAVPFAGYGDLIAEVTNVAQRGDLLDVTVIEPRGFGYTTVIKADGNVLVYPSELAGKWRR